MVDQMIRRKVPVLVVSFLLTAVLAQTAVPTPALAGLRTGFFHNFPELEWMSVETEHFVIHYYGATEYTARLVAKICDDVYDKVTSQFDYPLNRKTHIVVRDQEENANGFAVFSSDWITIWSTNLYTRLRGRMDWIPVVLTHEFAHIVSLKVNESFFEHAYAGVGLGLHRDGKNNFTVGLLLPVPGGMKAPFVWIEGGAEYWTHEAGINSWTTSRDMLLRASVLEGKLLTWEEMQTRGGKNRIDQERIYNSGYSMGLFLKETHGAETYARLGTEAGKQWRWNWNSVFEEVIEMEGDDFYDRWVEWLDEKYELQTAPIRADLHEGEKIKLVAPAKSWAEMSQYEKERDGILHSDSLQQHYPRFSPDGRWLAYWRDGGSIILLPITEEALPQYSGEFYSIDEAWEIEDGGIEIDDVVDSHFAFSPEGDRIVFSAQSLDHWYGQEWSLDGYYRNDLVIASLVKGRGGEVEDISISVLTDELRAVDPDWSPDGGAIAFVRNIDGRHALGVRPLSGNDDDIRWLLEFEDNTQLCGPVWSPDGGRIAFQVFREGQSDLAVVDADGGGFRLLTFDASEERDLYWAPDGKIFFSSDRSGVFNIYALDPTAGSMVQVTNVLGGAYHPFLTDKGNLLYSGFTAYGWKLHYLRREDFSGLTEAGWALPEIDPATAGFFAPQELPDLSPTRYNFFEGLQAPFVGPGILYDNEHIRGGFDLLLTDYLETHTLLAEVMIGADYDVVAQYVNEMWYPDFSIAFQQAIRSMDLGSRIALNPTNPDVLAEVEVKQKFRVRRLIAAAGYELSPELSVLFDYTYRTIEGKSALTAHTWDEQIENDYYTWGLFYSNVNHMKGDNDINPRDGREFSLAYVYGITSVAPLYAYDDQDILEDYSFNRFDLSFTEYVPVPFWPLNKLHNRLFDWLDDHNHTLELSFQGGYVDSNVHVYDEYHAGGRIPLITIADFSSNVQFAGFEAFSISGETMLIASLAYRFPFPGLGRNGEIDRTVGPVFVDKLYASIFTTSGNVWSYDPVTGDREVPFSDRASNGNRWLLDVGLELRLKSYVFNAFFWNSFFRVAYGFQDVYGVESGNVSSDVNGDLILEDIFPDDPYRDEVEKAGVRFYFGIGTGW